jgi:hypothetical protein
MKDLGVDNIKMELKEIGWEGRGLNSFGSKYRPAAGRYKHFNLRFPRKAWNFLAS